VSGGVHGARRGPLLAPAAAEAGGVRRRRWPLFLLVAAGLLAVGPVAAAPPVELVTHPPVVERRVFDPAAPPADLPPLEADERAITQAAFRIAVGADTVGGRTQRDGTSHRAKVRVAGVAIQTWLTVTLWLPRDASPELVAHEEGHQRLVEQLYAEAEAPLREAAERWVGRELEATGPSADEARDAAAQPVIRELSAEWLAATHGQAEVLGARYDLLTDSGRQFEPSPAAAVDTVLREGRAEAAADAP
jgi:hypothetical protein